MQGFRPTGGDPPCRRCPPQSFGRALSPPNTPCRRPKKCPILSFSCSFQRFLSPHVWTPKCLPGAEIPGKILVCRGLVNIFWKSITFFSDFSSKSFSQVFSKSYIPRLKIYYTLILLYFQWAQFGISDLSFSQN